MGVARDSVPALRLCAPAPSIRPARRSPRRELRPALPGAHRRHAARTVGAVSWTRLDDGWTDQRVFEGVPFDARWHYLAMVQFCSRNGRYDGTMRAVDALRCSDVDDPMTALGVLAAAGLVDVDDTTVRVVHIELHIPPPHLRDEDRKRRQRDDTRRHRAHRSGDHSMCGAGKCADVSAEVSTYTGTGRDGTGQDGKTEEQRNSALSDASKTDAQTVADYWGER